MSDFILRELTEQEHEKLDSFIADETTDLYQYFIAIITTDLIPEGEPLWEKALEKVEGGYHTKEMPFCICGVIDAWIRLCMEYKNYGLVNNLDIDNVRGLSNNINTAIGVFSNSIYYDGSIGSIGKKQNDLEDIYTQIVMQGVPKYTDICVEVDPELMYRFVMSAIEKLGFHLIVQSDNTRKIDLEIYRGIEF